MGMRDADRVLRNPDGAAFNRALPRARLTVSLYTRGAWPSRILFADTRRTRERPQRASRQSAALPLLGERGFSCKCGRFFLTSVRTRRMVHRRVYHLIFCRIHRQFHPPEVLYVSRRFSSQKRTTNRPLFPRISSQHFCEYVFAVSIGRISPCRAFVGCRHRKREYRALELLYVRQTHIRATAIAGNSRIRKRSAKKCRAFDQRGLNRHPVLQ